MSRIHEALKKAEAQRIATQGGQVETTPVEASNEAATATAVATAIDHAPAAVSGMPSFSSPFTFDTLLARCAPAPWSPDTKTMLFFNSDEQAFGSE